jgi:hypothetical protein
MEFKYDNDNGTTNTHTIYKTKMQCNLICTGFINLKFKPVKLVIQEQGAISLFMILFVLYKFKIK